MTVLIEMDNCSSEISSYYYIRRVLREHVCQCNARVFRLYIRSAIRRVPSHCRMAHCRDQLPKKCTNQVSGRNLEFTQCHLESFM